MMKTTMDDDDDDVLGIDLDAWQPPPPPTGLADRVIDRVRRETTQVTVQALPVEPEGRPASKRWWIAGGIALAAATATFVTFGMTRPRAPASGAGDVVATRAAHLDLGPSSAELDERTVVAWRRDRYRITAQQAGGAATWRVDDDDTLTIETALGSIEATNASLRVEVKMLDEKKTIALGAVTAAAVAVVTIVVYEGVVKVDEAGKRQQVMPGTAYQIKATGDNVIEQEQLTVGAASPSPEMLAKIGELEAKLAQKQAELDELQRTAERSEPRDRTSLDRVDIARTVKALAPKIRPCGDGYVGKVTAAVRVRPDGSVAAVTMTPTNDTSKCVGDVLQTARFGRTQVGGSFRYPFVFSAAPTPAASDDFSPNPFAKPTVCDASALIDTGKEAFAQANFAQALRTFDLSYKCKPDVATARLAMAAACRAKNLTVARRYYKLLDARSRDQLLAICVASGFENADLAR